MMFFLFPAYRCNHFNQTLTNGNIVKYKRSENSDCLEAYLIKYTQYECTMCGQASSLTLGEASRHKGGDVTTKQPLKYKAILKLDLLIG